jgi:hypothetical protein
MTNLPEAAEWAVGIYQIEQTDPVLGGPPNLAAGAGIANVQAEQLAKRTAWLKQEIATLLATQISTWNGITGGGTLDGGLTLTADFADWGEAQAGSSASKVMSALRVKQVVDAAIDALVGAAPAQMDTLNELAAAITENGDTSSALTALIASKLDAATYTPQDILAKLLSVDGTGSGLDADKLDGLQATSFFRADQSGALTNLGGSKQIFQGWAGDGSRWYLTPRKSDDSNWDWDFEFGFSRQNDWWYCDTDFVIKGHKAWHAGNHGAGSGLNADMLDGKHASEFALMGSNNLPSAWVNFNGQGTLQVRDALNVSSVTDLGAGLFRINFATPMANTDYGIWSFAGLALAAGDERGHCYINAKTANYLEIYTVNVHGTAGDWDDVSVLIMGGL